jgi:hypothetical protein
MKRSSTNKDRIEGSAASKGFKNQQLSLITPAFNPGAQYLDKYALFQNECLVYGTCVVDTGQSV